MTFRRIMARRSRMSRRSGLSLTILVFALLFLVGFHDARGEEARRTITYATLPPGTGHYSISVAQGQLLSKKGLRVVVQPATGPLALPDLVGSGEVDLTIGNGPTVYWAYTGKEEFKKPHKFIRLLMAGSDIVFSIVTRGDTKIKAIPDLKGKRLTGDYPTSRFQTLLTELELQAYGLSRKDVIMRKAEFSNTGLDDLAAKRTDAVQAGIIGPRFQELATKVQSIVVLPVEQDKVDFIKKTIPVVVPGRTREGLPTPTPVPGVSVLALLWAGMTMSDDTAYFIVKTLLENQKDLIPVYREFVDWSPQRAVRNQAMPYHPGAIRYYREKGLWTPDMEKMQQALLGR